MVGYNKNHNTHALKKHACHEHPNLYKKWGMFMLQMVIETQSEEQISLASNCLTTNQIPCNKHFLRTWFYMLQKVTSLCLLLKIFMGIHPCDNWNF
jgi:hypothetical protein